MVVSNLNLAQLAGNFEPLCKKLRYEIAHSYSDNCIVFEQKLGFWLGSWKRKRDPANVVQESVPHFAPQLQNLVNQEAQKAFADAFSDPASEDHDVTAVVMIITLIYSQAPALDQGLGELANDLLAQLTSSSMFERTIELAEFGHDNWQLHVSAFCVQS